MKQKKGFTLIELLVVLVILAAIGLLLIPTVLDAIENFRGNSYENQIEIIESAAKLWGSEHLYALEFYEGDTASITLGQLKGEGYLEYEFVNPSTKKNFPDDMTITITKRGKKLKYHINTESGTDTIYVGKDQPRLTLRGDAVQYVSAGDAYVDPGVNVKNATGSTTVKITRNGTVVSKVDTGIPGNYQVMYHASNKNTSTAIIRTVIVK